MSRQQQLITLAIAIFAGTPSAIATHAGDVKLAVLHPYTHSANIPADADLSTIHWRGVKRVKVPVSEVTDWRSCQQYSTAEPGGSIYCPQTTHESYAEAYQVTYSYTGRPMASDEYGNPYFTFSVYFRPNELGPVARSGKAGAESFHISASRETIRATVLDQAQSTVCGNTNLHGHSARAHRDCHEHLVYTPAVLPSPYVKITVTPVTSR